MRISDGCSFVCCPIFPADSIYRHTNQCEACVVVKNFLVNYRSRGFKFSCSNDNPGCLNPVLNPCNLVPARSGLFDPFCFAIHIRNGGIDCFALTDIYLYSAERQTGLFVLHNDQDVLPETGRSEEHTSELQSLMRISYAVFCLKKK